MLRYKMKFNRTDASLFIPDSLDTGAAITRTTHLGIGAHQDDLEFMALHGILACYQRDDRWFGGVTCTDGAGSSRTGPYANYTDAQMKAVRVDEQKAAAVVGQYGFIAQLAHPSSVAKHPDERGAMVDDLVTILREARPQAVYTHHPFDKHATHVGIFLAVLEAIRRLPPEERPGQLLGCEVWRGLDWLPDDLKVVQPLDAHPNLAAALNGIFDSQITGGKRYDLAVEGRRLANATFFDSHACDAAQRIAYAIDLTALANDASLEVCDFVTNILNAFTDDVTVPLQRLQPAAE